MSNYNLQIQKVLLDLNKLTDYDDRISLLKQAIKIADANRDIDWGFDLRMNLIRTEQLTNHSTDCLPAFAWILDAHDNNPGMFSNDDVLYEYKWIAGVVYNNLNITISQVDNILDDFRRRLTNSGYSLREYFNIKINQSLFKGEKILAREYLELRDREQTDNMSSPSNDLITTIYVEMLEGNFDSALANATEYFTYQNNHPIISISVYSGLIYYLGGKRHDNIAEEYYQKAEKDFLEMTKYPFHLYELSLMLYYLAKYNKNKAWEYFEEFVNWEIGAEESIRFDFSLSILPLFKEGGKRTLETIGIRHPYYREDNIYDLHDLYKYYSEVAIDLAQKFDERNGNKHFNNQLKEEFDYLNSISL